MPTPARRRAQAVIERVRNSRGREEASSSSSASRIESSSRRWRPGRFGAGPRRQRDRARRQRSSNTVHDRTSPSRDPRRRSRRSRRRHAVIARHLFGELERGQRFEQREQRAAEKPACWPVTIATVGGSASRRAGLARRGGAWRRPAARDHRGDRRRGGDRAPACGRSHRPRRRGRRDRRKKRRDRSEVVGVVGASRESTESGGRRPGCARGPSAEDVEARLS
jgi:hypothetical protein